MKSSFIILSLIFIFNWVVFSQIKKVDGKIYSDYVTIKFFDNVFDETNMSEPISLSKIKSEFTKLKNTLSLYGNIKFEKLLPNAIYGDTIRYNKNGERVKIHDLSLFYRILFPEPIEMWKTVHELEGTNLFEYVDPPVFNVPCITPNDYSMAGDQWYLDKINAPLAWDITKGNNNVIIGIIDKGIKTDHPDLADKIISGGSTTYSGDHGTEVAGLSAASTDNGIGISSLGWNLKLKSYNYLDWFGGDGGAINDAYNSGVDVINCSYFKVAIDPNDYTKYINYDDYYLRQNIENAIAVGVIVVAAAGNENEPIVIGDQLYNPSEAIPHPVYPAANEGVIGVSATDRVDEFLLYYNYGAHVDISAPGKQIWTTSLFSGGYIPNEGTSLSAPIVAALAGLIKSISPDLTSAEVVNIIQASSQDLGSSGYDQYYGYGRIDAYQALKYAIENYNTTLSGNIIFQSDITIKSGTTLTILPNSIVKFAAGATLKINGTLTVEGTSSSPITFNSIGTSKWGGIKLQSTASANSVIKYCNIDNANQGIYIGLSNSGSSNFPTVEYNTITNCNDGIYLYNSEGSSGKPLRYNDVSGSTNGIRFEGLAGYSNYVWITNNSLYNNESGLVIRYAHPRLFYNHSTCNGYGVKVENYSYPKFAGTSTSSSGYNRFADNSGANLYANNNVNVWMGQLNEVDEGQYGGNNTLGSYDDSQNPWFPYYIKAYNASTVMANYSYFGAFPPVSWKIDKDGSSSIDYTNYLNFDPAPGSACSESIVQNFRRDNDEPSLISSSAEGLEIKGKRLGGFATKGVSQSAPSLLLYLGMHHYMMDNPDSAAIIFGKIISSYPDSTQAIFALNWLARTLYENKIDTLSDFISKFENKYGMDVNKNSYALYEASLPLLAGSFANRNSMSEAVSTYDIIINKFEGRESAKYAAYSKLAYYINIENDKGKAAKLYNELASQFPTDPLLADALILLGEDPSEILAKIKLAESEALQKSKNQLQKSDEDNLVVKEYKLQQNYPNPFNPSTIIQYQIPVNGRVKLAVYDILGRQVQELVNEFQSSGAYKINFNANRNVASGVYYYSIRVDAADGNIFTDTRKMMVVK